MIINDCALSTQNAPGAISISWMRTATVFKKLSGSFYVPYALIRPSYLPPPLISFDLPHSLSPYRENTGMAFTPHHSRMSPPCFWLIVLLWSSSCGSHWAPCPMNHFVSCHSDHNRTFPFSPNAINLKGGGILECCFVFQPLYPFHFKGSCIFIEKNQQNTDK